MSFFESLLLLLFVAVLLLQVSRRLAIPYPAMLAAAGVGLALIPSVPQIALDPHTALALFIAPALVDAAFDFPIHTVRKLWRPLFALAVLLVLFSAGAVAWLGVTMAGLPLFAALALGAIVAPPDAAAATAVLSAVNMPRRSVAVLKGESLLNDATALLLFSAAVALQSNGGIDTALGVQLGLAAPGGLLLGFALAKLFRHVVPITTGTLGGTVLEFVTCFGVWIVAERLHLSPVLCVVAFAMTIAASAMRVTAPRTRIHTYAVWDTAVFLLNVFAFLLMGLQARTIVGEMTPARLHEAAWFAGAVVLCLIVVRMAWVLLYNRLMLLFRNLRPDDRPASLGHSVLVGWCGMRGLVTLATAFALPASFPQRDLIVLTAFAVVLATLILQGMTLAPLVRLLKLDGEDGLATELAQARAALAAAAIESLDGKTGELADYWRFGFETARRAAAEPEEAGLLESKRKLGRTALRRQRRLLDEMRMDLRVGDDAFLILQEEIDFQEVSLSTENERHIEEN